jgi:proline dehydrogenase
MRRVLLWMAGSSWLRDRLPRLWFVRRAVGRFLPGEDAADALNAGQQAQALGIGSLYTRLGEHLTRPDEAAAVADHYLGVLEAIAERKLPGEVSVKPSQLGLDLDPAATYAHAARLAAHAETLRGFVWLDMESSEATEATLDLYERLRAVHPHVGVCLQAALHRTAGDLQRLLPLGPAIRLVKGAYAEPPALAYQGRREIDANFAALAAEMLEAARAGNPIRIALGTHDVGLIEQVDAHASALGLDRTRFEVQMLYGVRMDQQRRLVAAGYRVCQLISYGEAWYAWYMRRLAERPANVLFALRAILG